VQADTNQSAHEKSQGQPLQSSEADNCRREVGRHADNDAETEEHERHELRGRLVMAEEQQLNECPGAAQHKGPKQDDANRRQLYWLGRGDTRAHVKVISDPITRQ